MKKKKGDSVVLKNKDIIQSYVLTEAKYNFNVHEKRIMYRIIELQQSLIKNKKLNESYKLTSDLFNGADIEMPFSALLTSSEDKNHKVIRDALKSLNKKQIEYESKQVLQIVNFIERPKMDKYNSSISFRVPPQIFSAFLDFSKGFRKFELKVAMEFKSIYSMRFYELFSGLDNQHISYSISKLKQIFKLENKYKRPADFINKVVLAAKKELDEKSPYSFTYKPIKKGRKITTLQFFVYRISKNRDKDLEERSLKNKVSNRWVLKNETINYLENILLFSDKQIKNNLNLLTEAEKTFDFVDYLSSIKKSIAQAERPHAYVITCLKNKIKSVSEQKDINDVIENIADKFKS